MIAKNILMVQILRIIQAMILIHLIQMVMEYRIQSNKKLVLIGVIQIQMEGAFRMVKNVQRNFG